MLTHLCFFVDGQRRSIEGILKKFDDFVVGSRLKISVEKLTLYFGGGSNNLRTEITSRFPFEIGHLPVRYLGLLLLTKRTSTSDYMPYWKRLELR